MNRFATLARPALLLALGALASTTAMAAPAKKPVKVYMPGTVFKDATTKVCMPRAKSPLVGKDKSMPETLCETRDEWAAHGVEIVLK